MSRLTNTLVVVLFAVFSSSAMGATAVECAIQYEAAIDLFLAEGGNFNEVSCSNRYGNSQLRVSTDGGRPSLDVFALGKTNGKSSIPGQCVINLVDTDGFFIIQERRTLDSDAEFRAWKEFVRGSCRDLL